jgi:flagellar biosynthesis protein FlhG
LELFGKINSDVKVSSSIKQRAIFSALYPTSQATRDMKAIANKILSKLERNVLVDSSESGLSGLFRRLIEHF